MSTDVALAVVGGGIAGLAAAYRALEYLPAHRIALLERESRLGGKIRTEESGGFLLEMGPDTLRLSGTPTALCHALGLEKELLHPNPEFARLYIRRQGRLHPLSWGTATLRPETLWNLARSRLLSTPGLLRAAGEYFVPARRETGDESIAGFFTRRFGEEFYAWVAEPLLAGIYGGASTELSLEATLSGLRRMELEHGSVLGALLRSGPNHGRGGTAPTAGTATLRGGLEQLVRALEKKLHRALVLKATPVVRLKRRDDRYLLSLAGGEELTARAVILATPAPAAAHMLEDLDPLAAELLRDILFAPSVVVSLAFDRALMEREFDAYGYLCPRAEKRPVRAVTWVSNKFAGRSPAGTALIRAVMSEACCEEFSKSATRGRDQPVVEAVLQELRETLGIRAQPLLWRVQYWNPGMPRYLVGHRHTVRRIRARLEGHPGLQLAGCSYDGVGIPDCIASGFVAADRACGNRRPGGLESAATC
jgi:oxygen-dependent protoporphyrinogen oxidase